LHRNAKFAGDTDRNAADGLEVDIGSAETAANAVTASPMPEVVAPAASADDAERIRLGCVIQGCRPENRIWSGCRRRNSLGGCARCGVVSSRIPRLRRYADHCGEESTTGLGMQLRLVAGPLADAAAAAKICAALLESQRPCETTVFDGQRLAMKRKSRPLLSSLRRASGALETRRGGGAAQNRKPRCRRSSPEPSDQLKLCSNNL